MPCARRLGGVEIGMRVRGWKNMKTLCRPRATIAYSGEERHTACQHIVGQVQRSVSKLDDDVVFKLQVPRCKSG